MAYKGFDLSGKVALVTGGNSGIGLGMAEAMAQAGAAVCVWGTNEDKSAAALARLKGHGGKALALRCDVSDEAALDRCFAETVKALGRVDAFFANAGVSGRGGSTGGFAQMTTAEWRRVMSVNLDGAFVSLRAAARHMIERGGGGSLVSTASLAAVMGALMAMTRSMAVELARHQIRVNTIVPGWIDTPMTEVALHGEAFMGKVLPRVPMRRWGVGDDFGGIAVYLASDASRYHTGDAFIIDGGYLIF